MTKKGLSVSKIVFSAMKTYLYNLDIFVKYLSFPILGMFFGMFLIFATNYFYIVNLDKIQSSNPIFANTTVMLTLLLIISIPSFIITIKALIDYIIAFASVNSMCVMGAKRIVDVYNHQEVIKRRFLPYCVLIVVLSLIFGVLSIPIFLPILIVASIFLSLSVQIFTLEEDSTPYYSIRKSIETVKNNFWVVTFVLFFAVVISYGIVPYLLSWAVHKTSVINYLSYPVEKYLELLPISDINSMFAEFKVPYSFDSIIFAQNVVYSVIFSIITMYMLPFRSACCVNLYKGLSDFSKEDNNDEKAKKKVEKKNKGNKN